MRVYLYYCCTILTEVDGTKSSFGVSFEITIAFSCSSVKAARFLNTRCVFMSCIQHAIRDRNQNYYYVRKKKLLLTSQLRISVSLHPHLCTSPNVCRNIFNRYNMLKHVSAVSLILITMHEISMASSMAPAFPILQTFSC